MARTNCGCKPCSKPIPKELKNCKPFSLCVGNYVLYWDGACASIQERKQQIPNGTYTAITFENGCITAVGNAPLPQYTPQTCCDGGAVGGDSGSVSGDGLTAGNVNGNLVTITNGKISVTPVWSQNGTVKVTGLGTALKPWEPNVVISNEEGNSLVKRPDGLFAKLHFKATETVDVKGKGTAEDPYTLNVKGSEATLPKINAKALEGSGYTIDEEGRIKADENLVLLTSISSSNPAITFTSSSNGVVLHLDETKLSGGNTSGSEIDIQALAGEVLTNIDKEGFWALIKDKLAEEGYKPCEECQGSKNDDPNDLKVTEWVSEYRIVGSSRRGGDADQDFVTYQTRQQLYVDDQPTGRVRNERTYSNVEAKSRHNATGWIRGTFEP